MDFGGPDFESFPYFLHLGASLDFHSAWRSAKPAQPGLQQLIQHGQRQERQDAQGQNVALSRKAQVKDTNASVAPAGVDVVLQIAWAKTQWRARGVSVHVLSSEGSVTHIRSYQQVIPCTPRFMFI